MPRRTQEPDEEPEVEEVVEEAELEWPAPKAVPETKPVSIIERIGKATVVQWMDEEDDYHKSTIPADEIEDGQVAAKVLAAGEGSFTWEGAGLDAVWAKALRRARVFDPEDFGRDPNRATGAIQRTIQSTIKRVIREYRHG